MIRRLLVFFKILVLGYLFILLYCNQSAYKSEREFKKTQESDSKSSSNRDTSSKKLSAKIGNTEKLNEIIKRLQDEDSARKAKASIDARELIDKNQKNIASLVPYLVSNFNDSTPLGWVPKGALWVDQDWLRTSPAQEAHETIVKIGSRAKSHLIERLHQNENDMMNIWCLASLYRIGVKSDKYIERLTELLLDNDEKIRENVAWALGKIGRLHPSLDGTLKKHLLMEKDHRSRMASLWALFQIDHMTALPFLIKEIENNGNTACALMALVEMGDKAAPAVAAISNRIMESGDNLPFGNFMGNAIEIMKNVKTEESAKVVAYLLDNEHYRDEATKALVEMGKLAKPYLDKLLIIIKDTEEHWLTRRWAIQAIANVGRDARHILPELEKIHASHDEDIEDELKKAIRLVKGYK